MQSSLSMRLRMPRLLFLYTKRPACVLHMQAFCYIQRFIFLFYRSLQNTVYHKGGIVQILFLDVFVNSMHISHTSA